MENTYNEMSGRVRVFRRLLCVVVLSLCSVAVAMSATVTGRVTFSADKSAVIGATVVVDGTNIGAITDVDGNFRIPNAPSSGSFTISYIGYAESKHVIVDNKRYDVALVESAQKIDDVVVVGYGTMRKAEVTGAVTRVDMAQIGNLSTSDISSALQGQIAGVNVQASSGQPGEAANVQIRGVSSVTGSNTPLYVVDGVPYDSDPGLSAEEIASIDVLKDAASAAIYGTRGAGGVILITTKTGEAGKPKISLSGYCGIQNITSSLNLTNTVQAIAMNWLTSSTTETANASNLSQLSSQPLRYLNDTSAVEDMIEQDNQPVYNVSLSVSGGNDDLKYSLVANYFNQEGVIYNTGFDRLNVRARATFKKNKWSADATVAVKSQTQERAASQLYTYAYSYMPYAALFDPDEIAIALDTDNDTELTSISSAVQKFLTEWKRDLRNYNLNVQVGYDITRDLNISTRLSSGYTHYTTIEIDPLLELYRADGSEYINSNLRSSITNTSTTSKSFNSETMLNYAHKWGKHDFKATAVFSAEKYDYNMFAAQAYDLISNDLTSIGATTGDMIVTGSSDYTSTIVGMLGRVQYNYDSRYLFSASVRRDGSSRFAEENRWGMFPSVSAGWNVSEERFWDPIKDVVTFMKVRASYGTTGNQNFDDYTAYASIVANYDYAFGDSLELGSTQTEFANADVKWETTKQANLGVDFGFLKGKLTATVDIYKSNKENMLFGLTIPPTAGVGSSSTITLNVGDMENKGVEVALGWNDKVGNFGYSLSATYARNINTITSMPGSAERVALGSLKAYTGTYDMTFLSEGYEAGAYFVYKTDGVINTDEELEEYQKLEGKSSTAQMGDLKYVDTNGDGAITDEDKVYAGSGAPEAEIGFNATLTWKSFDLSMNWYASLGNEIVNGSYMIAAQRGRSELQLYQWSWDNPFSTIPNSQSGVNSDNYDGDTDLFIEDGSFLRLKNIVLGYTLPRSISRKAGLTRFRVYIAADNIWTITKYTGYDPEVGNDGLTTRGLDAANYPISAQVRAGVQVNF